jgi:sugar lactone lactonase YvrE
VVDTGIVGVHIFSATGETAGAWTETGEGAFKEPLAIVAEANNLWVLDSERQWLYQLDPNDGTPLGKIGGVESNLYHPRGLAKVTGQNGEPLFAIANTGSGNIAFFNVEGEQVASLGSFGNAPGQLNEPVDLLQDNFGAFYVTEGANAGRWQWLNANGTPLGVWLTDAPVALDGAHLAWVGDGSLFATNSQTGTLRRYAPDGTLLDEWHTIGDVTFQKPVGVFVDDNTARLFIADVGAGKVYVFQIAF